MPFCKRAPFDDVFLCYCGDVIVDILAHELFAKAVYHFLQLQLALHMQLHKHVVFPQHLYCEEALAQEFGNVSRCGYYDLKIGKVVYEQFLEAKIEKLHEILRSLALQKTWVWEMTEDLKQCRYCPYTLLCQREL